MYHSQTKHIDIRYHWIREVMDQQLLRLVKIHTKENLADMLTNVVTRDKLELCKDIAEIAFKCQLFRMQLEGENY